MFRPGISVDMVLQFLELQREMGEHQDGVNRGVAYESELLVVKMGNARENSFPRTTELMEGIDYLDPTGSADGEADCYQYQFWK